ncbi:MAG TPA: hypothetical protein VF658_14555 [Pyrinomonadaceae bacterium]
MWALWAVLVVVFFSLSGNKLPNYVLPALPAFVLLVAWRLDSIWQVKRGLSTFEAIVVCVPGIMPGLLFLIVGVSGYQWRAQPNAASWLAKNLGALFNWKEQSQSVELLWRKLTVITSLASYWIVLGAVLLLSSLIVLVCWRKTPRAIGSLMALSLALIVLAQHFGLPAWSNYNAAPLNELGQRTLPTLQRGEPLVMYALHPKRPSLRYLLGYTSQIVETFSQESLQSVLRDAGRGYILTANDTTLPFLPGPVRQEAVARQWTLWRYDGGDK